MKLNSLRFFVNYKKQVVWNPDQKPHAGTSIGKTIPFKYRIDEDDTIACKKSLFWIVYRTDVCTPYKTVFVILILLTQEWKLVFSSETYHLIFIQAFLVCLYTIWLHRKTWLESLSTTNRVGTPVSQNRNKTDFVSLFRLEKEHSQFLSFENGAGSNGPDAFVEEEKQILEKIKHQHDVIEMERKVNY